MNNLLAKIGIFAIGLFIGGLVMKIVTDNAWKTELNNAKPVIVVKHDTVKSPPITIIRRLNPIPRDTAGPAQLKLTESDSLCIVWGFKFIQFWADLGYWPEQAFTLQDSLVSPRTLQYQDSTIGFIKLLYRPLPDFTATLLEQRPPTISSDTTRTTGPIVIPQTLFDYLIEYGGWALAFLLLFVGVK